MKPFYGVVVNYDTLNNNHTNILTNENCIPICISMCGGMFRT